MAQVYNKIFDSEKWDKVNKENKAIIDDYIMELKAQKKSQGTIKQYFNDLRIVAIYVLEMCDNRSFIELNRKDFRRFVLWLTDDLGVSNARANRLMSAVRTLLSYLEDDDDYDYDVSQAQKIKGLKKEEVREIQFLDNDTILALYDKFMKEEKWQFAMLLGLLYDSGARKNEVAQVRRDSIQPDKHSTNIVIGKRGKKFALTVFRLSQTAFEKYNEWRGEDNCESLFITGHGETARPATSGTIYSWVVSWRKDLKELTGEDIPINVHTFRHSYINNFLNSKDPKKCHYLITELGLGDVPLEKIKVLVHHESSDTTLHYAENNEDKEIEDLFGIKL